MLVIQKEASMPKRVEFGLVVLAILVLFGSLAVFFWDFVRDTVVLPLYYVVWVGGLVLNGIPQQAFLALIVVVSLWIALDVLLRAQGAPLADQRDSRLPRGTSRYREWIKRSGPSSGELAHRTLAGEVRQLILSVLVFQEGLDLAQAERSVADRSLVIPERIRSLIVSKQFQPREANPNRMSRVIRRVRGWLDKPIPSDAALVDEQIDEILQFLESRLEMTHE